MNARQRKHCTLALLETLGLTKYHPEKISLQDVTAIRSAEDSGSPLSSIPWRILQKLIMVDFKSRDTEIGREREFTPGTFESLMASLSTEQEETECQNALDVFLVIFECCDLILRQVLAQKLFLCRLALPFLSPLLLSDGLLCSLWALRSIILDWKDRDGQSHESSAVNLPLNTVTFMKLGNSCISKSMLMNKVLEDGQNRTFWNRECPNATSDFKLASGLVETQWYIPSGKPNDVFEDVQMFLNLRGDACQSPEQVKLLRELSDIIVCCIDLNNLIKPEVLASMRTVTEYCKHVCVVISLMQPDSLRKNFLTEQYQKYKQQVDEISKTETKFILGLKGNRKKTNEELKCEVQVVVSKELRDTLSVSIEERVNKIQSQRMSIDESEKQCKKAKAYAIEILRCMKQMSIFDCKKQLLPLQGKKWEDLTDYEKVLFQGGNRGKKGEVLQEQKVIMETMQTLRTQQLEHIKARSPMLDDFINKIVETSDSQTGLLMLQWLKLYLDEKTRNTLPVLRRQYQEKWSKLTSHEAENSDKKVLDQLRQEVRKHEKLIIESSFGLEHLFREVAQLYEVYLNSKSSFPSDLKKTIEKLPEVTAKYLLRGLPLEIMDGDVAHVPLNWVKAVLLSLKKLIGNKRLYSISVLGVQSSGKSTLLNTMFGLQLAVSAGRCTRGVYMQLLPADTNAKLPYDYVMVIDSEGLRAHALDYQSPMADNRLATFVIGLGDMTIVNVKGENTSEISDVLQIAVHAFIRMKLTTKMSRSCIFIHQNVAAINAHSKVGEARHKLQRNLDKMTKEACAIEQIVDIHSFNAVIQFKSHKDVWYFPDLWYGNPPMAPINSEYSMHVQQVRKCLLYDSHRNKETVLTISSTIQRLDDLWKALLTEDFVFNFKNCLSTKAYYHLERNYWEQNWYITSNLTRWVKEEANVRLKKCGSLTELDDCFENVVGELRMKSNELIQTAKSAFSAFLESHELREIMEQWKNEKLATMFVHTECFEATKIKEIRRKKEKLVVDISDHTREETEQKIVEEAKNAARNMKGKVLSDQEVNSVINPLLAKYESRFCKPSPSEIDIEAKFQRLLYQQLYSLKSDITLELKQQKGHVNRREYLVFSDEDITAQHLSIDYSKCTDFLTRQKRQLVIEQECICIALENVNDIFADVSNYLKSIENDQSGFQETYASCLIRTVQTGVDTFNQNTTFFKFKTNLLAKIVVCVYYHAMHLFEEQQKAYRKDTTISKKVKAFRQNAVSLFKNTVQQLSPEVMYASVLFNVLKGYIEAAVKDWVKTEIENEFLKHFSHHKYNLIVKILEDLADADFDQNCEFLKNPKGFALTWLTSYINGDIFSGKNSEKRYGALAEIQIENFEKYIKRAISCATTEAKKKRNQTMEVWTKAFCKDLVELSVKEADMKIVIQEQIRDFDQVHQKMHFELVTLMSSLVDKFQSQTAVDINWGEPTPYQMILDQLWGCGERCPFCKELCQWTDPRHTDFNQCHQCIQHKPQGVGGVYDSDTKVLQLETCSFDVQSNATTKYSIIPECVANESCKAGDDKYEPYKDYKKYLPDWEIAPSPNMESSKYWLWFMAKYSQELAKFHSDNDSEKKPPTIPARWKEITKEEAIDSLQVYTN